MTKNTVMEEKVNIRVKPYTLFTVFMLLYLGSGYNIVVSGAISGFISVMTQFAIAIVALVVSLFKRKVHKGIGVRSLMVMVLLITTALLSMLFRGDSLYDYAIILFAVVTGYLVTTAIKFDEFSNAFITVMFFLAVFSLVVFVILCVDSTFFTFAPFIGIRSGRSVHDLLFTVTLSGALLQRNFGLFWEPGAYQTFVNFALILELFYERKPNWKHVIGFIATIITTFSTTGYIALFVIIAAYVCNIRQFISTFFSRHKKGIRKSIALTLLLVLVVVLLLPNQYINLTFGKLNGLFQEDEPINFTTETRLDAVIYPLMEFVKSPLYGIGYDNFNIMSVEKNGSMPTCTPINWFALFGILWGVPCNALYLRNIQRFAATRLTKAILVVALLIIISSESYLRNVFIYILVFYGFDKIRQSAKQKYKTLIPDIQLEKGSL